MGTLDRRDDTMARYSSRGPTCIDFVAKPDLVAPGTGTVSLAAPGSTFYATKSASTWCRRRTGPRLPAVPDAERHEHGGAGRVAAPWR